MNSAERLELAKARIIAAITSVSADFGIDAFLACLITESALYEFRKAIDLQLAQNATAPKEETSSK